MGARDPRVDDYIAKAGDFAKPVLSYLREIVHKGCPDVTETMKWSSPFFMRNGILCNMAAFKEHCTFGFWRGREFLKKKEKAMGQFGRITSLKDLPSEKTLIGYVKKAALLSESAVKREQKPRAKPQVELATPPELDNALQKNEKAAQTFKNFSPSHRREYIEWITEAKREETRRKRVEQTVKWLTEGKPRHWKYQNC